MSGKYALIIGNKEYIDSGLAQLITPGRDADDFARVLNDQEVCAFDQVKVVLDQPSSKAIEEIDEFFDEKKPDDLLVFYFSGHGVRDEFGSLYLAFKNTIRARLRSTAVKSDYIREAMDQSRSKRQVVILDCCNSGAFPQGTKAEVGGRMGLISVLQGYGRFVLTASDATQFAWEGNQVIGETQNSLFTHFLVKGLQGEADVDGDGEITVDELYDYAYQQIAKITPKQTPTKSASRQEGEIVLRKITRLEDIKPIPLPPALIDSIENSLADVRLVAVQQLEKMLHGKNLGLARSAREALKRMATTDDSQRVVQAAKQVLDSSPHEEQVKELERLVSENIVPKQAKPKKTRQEAIKKKEPEAEERGAVADKHSRASLPLFNRIMQVAKVPYRPMLLLLGFMILVIAAASVLFLMLIPQQVSPAPTPTLPLQPTNTLRPVPTNTLISTPRAGNIPETGCPTTTASVKAQTAYLREGPDLRFEGISQHKTGEQFTVLARYKDWFHVASSDGNQGWLYKDWLTLSSSTAVSDLCLVPQAEVPTISERQQNKDRCEPSYYDQCE